MTSAGSSTGPTNRAAAEDAGLQLLLDKVCAVEHEMLTFEAASSGRIGNLSTEARASAANLLHYLTLRREDLREVQSQLARLGLSSLGRAEPSALANIRAVRRVLEALCEAAASDDPRPHGHGMDAGPESLRERTINLLGPEPDGRGVRVMVTMPSEAAHDYELVKRLIEAGMNVMRINCAHDGPVAWQGMVNNLRRACEETARVCRLVMDIEGPKLRTGPIEPGPRVVAWRVRRTSAGDLIAPSLIGLGPASEHGTALAAREALDAWVPVEAGTISALNIGSELEFTDRPGRRRSLRIIRMGENRRYAVAESIRSAFLETGAELLVAHGAGRGLLAIVGDLPALQQSIELRRGDELFLTIDQTPGRNARYDAAGTVVEPARAPITLPQAAAAVRVGHRVLLDDGKAEGEVIRTSSDGFAIRLTRTRTKGFNLRADQGVNLPDTHIPIPALTSADREALGFVAAHADAVEFSFVRTPEDLVDLRQALEQIGGERLGVVLKIETAAGFDNLPELLLAALSWPSAGVMIARGDLAVEVGYQRMAEVQEEILWLCEAAHLPVIWATQVLESLAKKGIPSRSEITDAAMGERAECVMLNKGPYVLDAVRMLDDILKRMTAHQTKKRSMLRPLKVAKRFGSDRTVGSRTARESK